MHLCRSILRQGSGTSAVSRTHWTQAGGLPDSAATVNLNFAEYTGRKLHCKQRDYEPIECNQHCVQE